MKPSKAVAGAIALAGALALAGADRTQGLAEIAARSGFRQMELFKRGGSYLSERTVLRDIRTGAIAWRMTSDPAVDANDYYDLPSWNADGSVMSFLSSRRGCKEYGLLNMGADGKDPHADAHAVAERCKEYWLMDADGSHIRPLPLPVGGRSEANGSSYWSVRYRDRFYQAIEDGKGTAVTAIDPFTGTRRTIVRVDRKMGEMMPPHPSDEWFLFGSHETTGDANDPSKAWVVGLDGSVRELSFERRWHRLRFTKAPDRRIFFNFDAPRSQWTILPNGTGRTSIPDSGSHPDFLPDGSELFYFAADENKKPHVWGIRYDGTGKRQVGQYRGHGGPSLGGDWFVADGGAISVFKTDGSRTGRVLFYPQSSGYGHTNAMWHPDHHTTHAHASFSPDGTKVIFNSDFLGQYTDVYVAINRFPDPPRELRVSSSGAALEWCAPSRGREIRGYHIYRSRQSGVGYERVTTNAVRGVAWSIPAQARPGYFVVTAVEHSGLESRASEEVHAGGGGWEGAARVIVEAEAGTAKLPMEESMDQQAAANGLYVASRDGKAGGTLLLNIAAPKPGTYRLWARVRGHGTLDAGRWGAIDSTASQWTWKQARNDAALSADAVALELKAGTGGEAVDKVLLTDDAAFVPNGTLALDGQAPPVPTGAGTAALSPNTVKVAWTKSPAADLDHYNVYSGAQPDFACSRAALLASPSEPEFVDWGLPLNSSRWYRITAVDRAGNESGPSAAVRGGTAPFKPVRISLQPAEARLSAAKLEKAEAAGGVVMRASSGGGGAWEFALPREGEYAVWVRSTHEKGKPSSFELSIDGQPRIAWRAWGQWGRWLWSPAGEKIAGAPRVFRIAAGRHTLRISAKSNAASAAEIVITDDPSWWPVTGMSTAPRGAAQ